MPPKKVDKRRITSAENIRKALERKKQLYEEPELSDELSDEEEIIIQKKRGIRKGANKENLELPPNDLPNIKLMEMMREEVFTLRKQLENLTTKKRKNPPRQNIEVKKPQEYKENQVINNDLSVKKKDGKPTFELKF